MILAQLRSLAFHTPLQQAGKQRLILAGAVLLGSLALSLGQPNEFVQNGSVWLGLVGLVPIFWALRRARSSVQAVWLGCLFGLSSTLFQNHWLGNFPNFGFWALAGVLTGMTLYGALLGPFLRYFLQIRRPWGAFSVGALWAVYEFLKSNGFLGFPWGLIPYPLHQWLWAVQIIDVFGLAILSFWIATANAWIVDVLERKPGVRETGFFLVITFALSAVYGFHRLSEVPESRGTAKLALIQQNGDPWNSGDELTPLKTSVDESLAVLEKSRPDMMIWSETSLRWPLQEWRPYYERNPAESPLLKTIRASRTWWLFGNPYAQDTSPELGGWVNATVLMNPQAQIVDYYGKIQQVPFAEYIPFWDVPTVRRFFQDVVGLGGSWELGRQWTQFEIPVRGTAQKLNFATPICFEDAFPWLNSKMVREGAEVLINLTNDTWSGQVSSEEQHFVAAMFRTIENRVTLIRSTNSGVSAVVDERGQIVAGPLPFFEPGHLVTDVSLPKHHIMTPYTLYGDWLVVLFVFILGAIMVVSLRRSL